VVSGIFCEQVGTYSEIGTIRFPWRKMAWRE
jgi:hypothetical protein